MSYPRSLLCTSVHLHWALREYLGVPVVIFEPRQPEHSCFQDLSVDSPRMVCAEVTELRATVGALLLVNRYSLKLLLF